ncbi:MAG: undecaprenyl-diphosphate phosphatase [Thermoleophilia bacterium]|nr:undecaprenyl-diphosphate phosphatase [Thermoleophilia bacterium]
MSVLDALILGVVQGLTEFLPVSSSGHLVLVPEFFNIPAPTLAFDVLVHVATLLAVLGYFIRDIAKIVLSVVAPRRLERQEVKFWRRILLWMIMGSIPAALAGFLLDDFFESLFDSTLAVGVFLIVTSLLLWGSDFALGRVRRDPAALDKMRAPDAIIVGCFQALAIAPGLSRSGSTIAAGVFLGFDRPSAARFSFLLSIPVIFGAFISQVTDIAGGFAGASGAAYAVGAIAAAISGFVAVWALMRYVRAHRMTVFAVYTAVLGIIVIVLSLV